MNESQALLCIVMALFALSMLETAVARNFETHRRGDAVVRVKERRGELFVHFARVLSVTFLANLSLATPVVAIVHLVGRERLIAQLKEWVWGGVLTLLLVVALVFAMVSYAALIKWFLYHKLRGEERWRAGWLGLLGAFAWTYMMCAGTLLDWRGTTSIEEAVSKNNLEAATSILAAGRPPARELEAAWQAVPVHGDSKMADLLLRSGASINSRNSQGHTVLEEALLHHREELANHLLDQGAGVEGGLVLQLATRAGLVGVVRKALKKGSDPNFFTPDHITPLLSCIGNKADAPRAVEIATMLLEAGADPNLAGHSTGGAGGEVVEDETPLGQATTCKRLDVVELLVQHKARLDLANQNKMTPLHLALWLDYRDIAKLLIQKGAPLDKTDRLGRKPVDLTHDPELLRLAKP